MSAAATSDHSESAAPARRTTDQANTEEASTTVPNAGEDTHPAVKSAASSTWTPRGLAFPVNEVQVPSAPAATAETHEIIAKILQVEARNSSNADGFARRRDQPKTAAKPNPTIVDAGGSSHKPDAPLLDLDASASGFVTAVAKAFADHYPLALKPDHFWLLITQAISHHVNNNSEELRSRFVSFQGKRELTVQRDGFALGQANDWAGVVGEFEGQIRQNTHEGVLDAMTPKFTTTTATDRVAAQITVMSSMQKFFEFTCRTDCGFPEIALLGAKEDWLALCAEAPKLIQGCCLEELSCKWLPAVTSVLNEIRKTVEGAPPNVSFWQSFCKRGGSAGSGGYTWFNGWFNVFIPILGATGQANRFAFEPYDDSCPYARESIAQTTYGMGGGPGGMDISDVPLGVTKAPVVWDYHGKLIPLQFYSGFIGASQDPETKTIMPEVGWFIVNEGA